MLAIPSNVDYIVRSARMFFIASVLLLGCYAPLAQALVLRGGALHEQQQIVEPAAEAFSFLSIEQVPGPTPGYVKYGKPEFTTFNNVSSACQACVEFWPAKEDGGRFHEPTHEDSSGGVWDRVCRVGTCDFRDPQTDPVGGVVGKGDDRTCITRDPVPWFKDCEPVLLETTATILDATRYCSYREQMFIPPPAGTVSRFAGKPKAWERIGGRSEQCMATIQKEGAALFDGMSFCDSDLPALSSCCETVFNAFTCVAETASAKAGISQSDIFSTLNGEGKQMMETFAQYCVPLCQNTKPEFCEKWPEADICVGPFKGCSGCTSSGGLWCPKLESCHCPSKNPPCIAPPVTSPKQCMAPDKEEAAAAPAPKKAAAAAEKAPAAEREESLCKYTEMARMWKPRD